MAPRPYWKGYLKLSLVSCAVRLYGATTRSERISFHFLAPKTHHRIQMRPIDPETGREIARGDLVRGYEFEKGRYVVVSDAELDALEIASSKTIDLQRFVALDEVDPVYFEAPYYLAPDGKIADETYRVVQAAMRREGKAGIGRVVLGSREHPVLLTPRGRGILVTALRSAEEVRRDTAYFEDIGTTELDGEMIDLAARLVEQKSGSFDAAELAGDRYQIALRDLVMRKIKGEKPVAPKAATGGNVINLMDALRRSVTAGDDKPPAASRKRSAAPRQRKRAASGRRGKS